MSEISEGEQMLIHSRVDEDQTWNGTISGIDMESPQSNGDQYTDSSDSSDTTTSSKYPFYINLENSDGMMLGQHVFAEADLGQGQKKKRYLAYGILYRKRKKGKPMSGLITERASWKNVRLSLENMTKNLASTRSNPV